MTITTPPGVSMRKVAWPTKVMVTLRSSVAVRVMRGAAGGPGSAAAKRAPGSDMAIAWHIDG